MLFVQGRGVFRKILTIYEWFITLNMFLSCSAKQYWLFSVLICNIKEFQNVLKNTKDLTEDTAM